MGTFGKDTLEKLRASDTYEKFPCGCEVGVVEFDAAPGFVMKPCSVDCGYYQYFLRKQQQTKKPLLMADMRGEKEKIFTNVPESDGPAFKEPS